MAPRETRSSSSLKTSYSPLGGAAAKAAHAQAKKAAKTTGGSAAKASPAKAPPAKTTAAKKAAPDASTRNTSSIRVVRTAKEPFAASNQGTTPSQDGATAGKGGTGPAAAKATQGPGAGKVTPGSAAKQGSSPGTAAKVAAKTAAAKETTTLALVADGGRLPASLAAGGGAVRIVARVTPSEVAGQFAWTNDAALEVTGSGDKVTVSGKTKTEAAELKCVFTPTGGEPAVEAVHSFRVANQPAGLLFPKPGDKPHRQFVNLATSKDDGALGAKLLVRAKVADAAPGTKVYVRVKPAAENVADKAALTGLTRQPWCHEGEVGVIATLAAGKTDAFEAAVPLGQVGGNTFTIGVGSTPDVADEEVTVVVWRRLRYELTVMAGVKLDAAPAAPAADADEAEEAEEPSDADSTTPEPAAAVTHVPAPDLEGATAALEKVFIELAPGRTHTGARHSQLDSAGLKSYAEGYFRPAANTGELFHLLIVPRFLDHGPATWLTPAMPVTSGMGALPVAGPKHTPSQGVAPLSGWLTKVEYRLIGATRLPPDDANDQKSKPKPTSKAAPVPVPIPANWGVWQNASLKGRVFRRNGATIEADLQLLTDDLKVSNPGQAQVELKIGYRARGPARAGRSIPNHVIVCTTYTPTTGMLNTTLVHELGHALGLVPSSHPKHYSGLGGNGDHCSTGGAAKKKKGAGGKQVDVMAGGTCVMFHAIEDGPARAFCPECEPRVRKVDLSKGLLATWPVP